MYVIKLWFGTWGWWSVSDLNVNCSWCSLTCSLRVLVASPFCWANICCLHHLRPGGADHATSIVTGRVEEIRLVLGVELEREVMLHVQVDPGSDKLGDCGASRAVKLRKRSEKASLANLGGCCRGSSMGHAV